MAGDEENAVALHAKQNKKGGGIALQAGSWWPLKGYRAIGGYRSYSKSGSSVTVIGRCFPETFSVAVMSFAPKAMDGWLCCICSLQANHYELKWGRRESSTFLSPAKVVALQQLLTPP